MALLKPIRTAALAIAVLGLSARPAPGQEPRSLEYQVKAAFLYNFLKFVEWPDPGDNRPWSIGVAGGWEFAQILEDTLRGKTVNGRPVAVTRLEGPGDAGGCQVVFIRTALKLPLAVPPGVLTVGEDPGFLGHGGIINFYIEGNKVRFEISAEAARAAGLHVSSQLLKLGAAR